MRRRSLVLFIVLNVLISLGVVFGALSVLNPQAQRPAEQIVITVPILVTATPDPNATIPVRIVTATPLPGQISGLPTGILEETRDLTLSPAPTLDPTLLGANAVLQETATALPPGCILHTVEEGDTPFGIAEVYGVNGFDLMEVNGLDEVSATLLQIGDILIIPLEGCPLTREDIVTEAPDEVVTGVPATAGGGGATAGGATPTATITLAPTAVNAQVEIVRVVGAGDVTAEGVEIRNLGGVITLTGWTLSDAQGNTFTFPEQRLFTNGLVTVYTRVGQNTPIALYWGRSEAVWGEPGDVVTLADSQGVVQSTYRLPSPVELR